VSCRARLSEKKNLFSHETVILRSRCGIHKSKCNGKKKTRCANRDKVRERKRNVGAKRRKRKL